MCRNLFIHYQDILPGEFTLSQDKHHKRILNTPLPPKRQKKSDLFISFYLDYHWKVMQTPLSRFYINKAFYTSLTTILYIFFEICQILKTFLYNKVLSVQNLQIKKKIKYFSLKKQKNLQIKKTSSYPQGIFFISNESSY